MERYAATTLTDIELRCTNGSLYYSKHGLSMISDVFANIFLLDSSEFITADISVNAMTMVLNYASEIASDETDANVIASAVIYMYRFDIKGLSRLENYVVSLQDNVSSGIVSLIAGINPDALCGGLGALFINIFTWDHKRLNITGYTHTIFDICNSPRNVFKLHQIIRCERNADYWVKIAVTLSRYQHNVKKFTRKILANAIMSGHSIEHLEPLIAILKK